MEMKSTNFGRRIAWCAVATLGFLVASGCQAPGGSGNSTARERGAAPANVEGMGAEYVGVMNDIEMQSVLRADALAFLISMTESDYAGYRANAIEALAAEPEAGERAARTGLLDGNAGVRFAAAMVIGMEGYSDSAPLVHALLNDENESVQAAAIYALASNGQDANISALASFLENGNLSVRSNAALAIGELGDPSAIEMLREALEFSNPRATLAEQRLSDLQIAEAMAKLGDDGAISRIRAHLRGAGQDEGEVAALAATMLGNLNARIYQRDLVNMVAAWKEFKQSAEVRLAAMGALIKMGESVTVEMPMEYFGRAYADTRPNEFVGVRAQATYVLGLIDNVRGLPYLAELFYESDDEPVRLQSAAAILKRID